METTTENSIEKLYIEDMTQQKMYNIFGLQRVHALADFERT